jgi:hypothetical protein
MRAARMHQRSGRGACNAAGRPLVHALPCGLHQRFLGAKSGIPLCSEWVHTLRVPNSASRAAGEPPAPGAKVFTENVRHLGLIY